MLNYANAEQEIRALIENPKNQPATLSKKLYNYFDDVVISDNSPQIPYHLRITAYDEYGEPQIIVYCGNNERFGWFYDVQNNEEYMKGAYK